MCEESLRILRTSPKIIWKSARYFEKYENFGDFRRFLDPKILPEKPLSSHFYLYQLKKILRTRKGLQIKPYFFCWSRELSTYFQNHAFRLNEEFTWSWQSQLMLISGLLHIKMKVEKKCEIHKNSVTNNNWLEFLS